MKIRSQRIFNKNGDLLEHYVNHFNSAGLVERKEYFNDLGDVLSYTIFGYDNEGNITSEIEYGSEHNILVSYKRSFDFKNREIQFIQLNSENEIWIWDEKQFPNDDTIILISKDEKGTISSKTIMNIATGEEQTLNSDNSIYSTVTKEFDNKHRLVNRKRFDAIGTVVMEDQYSYIGTTKFRKFFKYGIFIKTEEFRTDRNGNTVFYCLKDRNGNCIEWRINKFDSFNNEISIEGGTEEGKPTFKTRIEIEYFDEKSVPKKN